MDSRVHLYLFNIMRKILLALVCYLPLSLLACPGCYDSVSSNPGAKQTPWTFIVIGIFILLSYIPFYILLRAAKKYEPQETDGNK